MQPANELRGSNTFATGQRNLRLIAPKHHQRAAELPATSYLLVGRVNLTGLKARRLRTNNNNNFTFLKYYIFSWAIGGGPGPCGLLFG